MSRFDDSVSRERLGLSRTTSGSVSKYRRVGAIALGIAALSAALGPDMNASRNAYSAEYGSIYSSADLSGASSAAAAASRSQYMQAQRQQAAAQQAAQQAYEQQALARQAAAQRQTQQQQMMQAQAQQAQMRQQQQQQQSGSSNGGSKRLLSGLWGDNSSSQSGAQQQQQQQQRQPLIQNPFQQSAQNASGPERNNILGFSPLIKRSPKPQQSQQQQTLSPQQQAYSQQQQAYAQAQTRGSYAGAQNASAQRPFAQPQRGSNYASAQNSRTAPTAEALAQASTDRNEARDVLARIPWDKLSPKAQQKVQQLTSSPTMYRRLPMAGGRCNPELFDFFLTHPNAVVELWHSMGYDEVTMVAEGNNIYSMREKSGSEGKVQVLYQDSELTLAYCSGSYRGPALGRQMVGEVFLVLQTRYTEDVDMTPLVVCRLDAFIDLKNPGVDLLARTFSSAIGKIADSNFEQTLAFVDSVSQTIEAEPYEFQQIAFSMQGLTPEARKVFAEKAMRVGSQAQARRRGEVPDYQLLAKMNEPYPTSARILAREKNGYGPTRAVASRPSVPPLPSSASENGYASLPSQTPGLNALPTTRAGSIASKPEFSRSSTLANNDFSLSSDDDDDFSLSMDWDDEEESPSSTFVYSSKGATPSVVAPGSSLAKVGAKPSTNSEAMDLIEEQEERATLSYSAKRPTTLSTDEDEDDELPISLNSDFVLAADDEADEYEDVEEDEDIAIAIPQLATSKRADASRAEALTSEPVVADDLADAAIEAAPLIASDDEPVVDDTDAPLLFLDLPDEDEPVANDDDSDVAIALPTSDAVAEESEEDDLTLALTDEALESANANAPLLITVDDPDEAFGLVAEDIAENPVDAADAGTEERADGFTPVVEEDDVETVAAPIEAEEETTPLSESRPKRESVEDLNKASGWVPVASATPAPAKTTAAKTTKVAARAETKTLEQGNWSAADRDEVVATSVPSKFVTRRYNRPVAEENAGETASKPLETFTSEWKEPEKTASLVDAPSFKKPR